VVPTTDGLKKRKKRNMKKLDRESTGNGNSNGNGIFINPIVSRFDRLLTKQKKEKKKRNIKNLTGSRLERGIRMEMGIFSIQMSIGLTGI
jgi:hypothetical protein